MGGPGGANIIATQFAFSVSFFLIPALHTLRKMTSKKRGAAAPSSPKKEARTEGNSMGAFIDLLHLAHVADAGIGELWHGVTPAAAEELWRTATATAADAGAVTLISFACESS